VGVCQFLQTCLFRSTWAGAVLIECVATNDILIGVQSSLPISAQATTGEQSEQDPASEQSELAGPSTARLGDPTNNPDSGNWEADLVSAQKQQSNVTMQVIVVPLVSWGTKSP
jgi:hypothetical protein